MSLKGNLSSVNLTEIFQMLSLSGREGTLFIYEGTRKRAICFTKEGVSIRSRERNEGNLLGKVLIRIGKMTDDDLARAVADRRATNKLMGDGLVDLGICTREDVELAFRIQSEEDIQDLFLNRSDAQFEYVDGYFPETDGTPYVHLNVNSLLIEIARRTDEWEYIRRRIRGPREIYRFTGVQGQVEQDLLHECYADRIDPFVDGAHAVGEIIDLSYVNKFHACKLLAAYLDANVIELVPPDAIRQTARAALEAGDPATAIRHFDYLMSTGDFPLEIMSETAEAHEANHDYGEAAALLRRLAEELVRVGNEHGAIDALRRVANYPKPEPEALRFLLDLAFQHPRDAEEFATQIIEAGKTLVAFHIQGKQRLDALSLLEKLVRAYPDEVSFAVSLVNVYFEDGSVDRAAAECEKMAAAFLKRRCPSPAVILYKRLLALDPGRNDVREKIRKIVSGRRSRPTHAAKPRLAVALAVSLLLVGVAVVYLRKGGGPRGNGSGGRVTQSVLDNLFGEAASEKGLAETHGSAASEEYDRCAAALAQDPLKRRDEIAKRRDAAGERLSKYQEHAKKAEQIIDAIRRQAGELEDVAARARTMLASLKDIDAKVIDSRRRWETETQKAAVALHESGVERYQAGKLLQALERFHLAGALSASDEWKLSKDLAQLIRNLEEDRTAVAEALAEARKREADRDWVAARRAYLSLIRKLGNVDLLEDVRLPVEIVTVPTDATVTLNGAKEGAKTPALLRLDPFRANAIRIRKPGHEDQLFQLGPYGAATEAADYRIERQLLRAATWRHNLGGQIESRPAGWSGRVAAAGRNGRWIVVDAASGKVLAERALDTLSGVAAGLVTDGRSVFVPLLDGALVVFDATTLAPIAKVRGSGAPLHATPALAGGVLYVADFAGNVAAYSTDGFAARIKDPKPLWSVRTAEGVKAPLLVHDDHIIVVSTSGEVAVLPNRGGAAAA
ncbi:MAG: DUF4388 domain-containing protein, partial [Planctomycetota bacterium]